MTAPARELAPRIAAGLLGAGAVVLALFLVRAHHQIETLAAQHGAARAALEERLAETRARVEAAEAQHRAAEDRLTEARQAAEDARQSAARRVVVVRRREAEIVAQPPSEAGARASWERAANFERRLEAARR